MVASPGYQVRQRRPEASSSVQHMRISVDFSRGLSALRESAFRWRHALRYSRASTLSSSGSCQRLQCVGRLVGACLNHRVKCSS